VTQLIEDPQHSKQLTLHQGIPYKIQIYHLGGLVGASEQGPLFLPPELVEGKISQQPLQPPILVLQRPKAAEFAHPRCAYFSSIYRGIRWSWCSSEYL
jgi:hypothetical protein